ncbi:MAG: acyltransferase family protein [Allorhizobium sp.]
MQRAAISADSPSMRYRAEIDGLRALSVIGVIVFHADLVISGIRLFPGGYLGVNIFFVISGYLISSILLSDLDAGAISVRSFYMRRVRRILPALYLVLGVSTATALALLPPDSLVEFSKSGVSALFFVANVYSWLSQGYFSEAAELSALLHVWSLSVEEQFYLAYPLLLVAAYGMNGRSLKWVLPAVAALSLISAFLLQRSRPDAVFYLASFRACELLFGALVVIIHRRGKGNGLRSGPGLVSCLGSAIVLSCFVLGYLDGASGYAFTVLSVFGACLVLLSDRESYFQSRVQGRG